MASSASLVFTVKRKEPEMIVPAEPTPYETKNLSDIDDQKGLRFQVPAIIFYQNVAAMEGKDPVKILRESIAKALVFYYPLAGRLRDGPNEKVIVECTGEGVLFIEAEADVKLEQFGDVLKPPFPNMENLLYDVPGSGGILDCPLLLMQVTRLLCGGFIVAVRLNHLICDGPGIMQFMSAVAEIAHGASVPSIHPIWSRELLNARDPPQVTCVHHMYDELHDKIGGSTSIANMPQVNRTFFFGPQEIVSLMNQLPPHLRRCSRFEILTAFIWRCRTMSLDFDLDEEVLLSFVVNARTKLNPPLPVGYYGNAFGLPVALSTVGELCENPLEYALELVRKAKADVTDEFIRSTVDLLVTKGRPHFIVERSYAVADLTRIGLRDIDFGWGKAIYGGPTGVIPLITSNFIPTKDKKGDEGILVTINLPAQAMEKFAQEIDRTMKGIQLEELSVIKSPP